MRATALASVLIAAAFAAGSPAAAADEHPDKAPSADGKGRIYTWKSADGLAYEYFVPTSYDPAKGANLLLILHGSNLDRRWGMANNIPPEFRPDDVIVSPDGTTPNGKGGFNFLKEDVKRVHLLIEEMKKLFKVRQTFLYGHSQGSFFSLQYAGAYAEDVNGVLAQASGVWGWTATGPKGHHQAIALMHGTADPVVPYFQSVGALSVFREAKYPLAHLRSLEGANHWPFQEQAAQELAWCEGMTSADPARVVVSYDFLAKQPDETGFQRDDAALYAVAKRLAAMEGAPADAKDRAAKSAQAVEDLAKRHAEAIAASIGKSKCDKVEDAAWLCHLPTFLRDFDGVPACDALAKDWTDRLAKQRQEGAKSFDEYWRCREKDPAKALAAGVNVIRVAFLWYRAGDEEFLKALAGWRNDPKLKLGKADAKAYDELVPAFTSGRKKGFDAYAELNKRL